MSNTLYQHINVERKGKDTRGTLCAVRGEGGQVRIGTSICSLKDQFSRKEGRDQALARALNGQVQWDAYCSWEFNEFLLRCFKYFRDISYGDIVYDYVEEK